MRVLSGAYQDWVAPEGGAAVTVGVYDGVHRGHQSVLTTVRRRAAELGGLPVTVATFDRHPLAVVAPERAPKLLTSLEQRLELLESAGVEVTAVLTFDDDLRDLDAEDFVADVLVSALGASLVAVGGDFRFGRGRTGNVEELATIGLGLGFYVEDVALVGGDRPVSWTTIRRLVAAGEVRAAADLLTRPFTLRGAVIAGARRGRTLGFPTANLSLDPEVLRPAYGVYAVRVALDGQVRAGVLNVGVRPTVDGVSEVAEVHLLDFDADIYGRTLDVALVDRIREERRFDGIDALAAQIVHDVDAARAMLAG